MTTGSYNLCIFKRLAGSIIKTFCRDAMPSFHNKNAIFSKTACLQGRNRDSKVENGLVDPTRKGSEEMNWERITDIYTLRGVNTSLTGSCCRAQAAQSAWCSMMT